VYLNNTTLFAIFQLFCYNSVIKINFKSYGNLGKQDKEIEKTAKKTKSQIRSEEKIKKIALTGVFCYIE